MEQELVQELKQNELRRKVIQHSFFASIDKNELTKENVQVFLEQYYYPIQYFTHYLSKLVSVLPTIEMQTFVSRILWQELGEGNSKNAHLPLYFSTMKDAGFDDERIRNSEAFPETKRLVDGYKKSTENYLVGLGFLYGTETIDLTIVSGLGKTVRKASGKDNLPWVDIHIKQEPDHVESSEDVLNLSFSQEEKEKIIKSAQEMWKLWHDFFSALEQSFSPVL